MTDDARDLEVDAYAGIVVELSEPGADRANVLAAHGLDETRWERIEAAWQARLSADDDDEAMIPPDVAAYAEAFARAQRARAGSAGGAPLSFQRFLEATRAVRTSGDMPAALARMGVGLPDYMRASQHWMQRMMAEPELLQRFEEAMR